MFLQVNGATTYAYTGGKAFNPAQPTVLFLHGVLNDHSVWILQSRYLACLLYTSPSPRDS